MANTKITTAVIKDDAITTAKIADDAVTGALIADDVALGFVAQEIEESSEVQENMNPFSIVVPTLEEDKNPLQPDDQQYNTQLSAKDALYVSAIQELSKEIELLKEEIKALKNG